MIKAIEWAAQVLVIIFIIHASIYSYKIARWSCARSVQWLTAGFIYILVWRVFYSAIQIHSDGAVANWVDDHQTYFIIAPYAMWAWGLYLLYKTLINLGRKNAQ